MILDVLTRLAAALAVTDADAYTTDSYDTGDVTPKRQVGTGTPLCLVYTVTVAAAGGGSLTDTFDFLAVQSANANLSAHTTIIQRRVAAAQLGVGAAVVVPIPPGTPSARYLGGRVELGTGDTITVNADIVPQDFVPQFLAYAKAYVV